MYPDDSVSDETAATFTLPDPPETARALIFDCDGTLVDTMGLHRRVWADLFGAHGFEMTDTWWEDHGNDPMEPFVRAAVPDADEELIEVLRVAGIDDFVARMHELEAIEHVVAHARRLHGTLPMIVVSGGFRDPVVGSLRAVGIEHLFDDVITADDVAHGKPAPDGYLLALDRLGLDAAHVVVYEDSDVGFAAAAAAQIATIVDIRLAR